MTRAQIRLTLEAISDRYKAQNPSSDTISTPSSERIPMNRDNAKLLFGA